MTESRKRFAVLVSESDVSAVRAFNRIYTSRLGLLDAHLAGSFFTLSEARILYEIASSAEPTAAAIARSTKLDPAQVSRTLKRFVERELIETRTTSADGRRQLLFLTSNGQDAFAELEGRTRDAIEKVLYTLPNCRRRRLIEAVEGVTRLFIDEAPHGTTLRSLRSGDLGMVTARQAVLYTREYGWNADYEALVARILAEFHESFDPLREAAWIADMNDSMVGSVFLVAGDEPGAAKLRLLYVEPEARGTGVGGLLVSTCVERARSIGYKRLDLWTSDVLSGARRIYQRAGFQLTQETPKRMFGQNLLSQTWSLAL